MRLHRRWRRLGRVEVGAWTMKGATVTTSSGCRRGDDDNDDGDGCDEDDYGVGCDGDEGIYLEREKEVRLRLFKFVS